MTFDPSLVAKGLAARLADVEATMDRHASFAFRPDEPSSHAFDDGDASVIARDLVRRALAAVADPVNGALLDQLAHGDATLAELAEAVGLPRPAVWERVNDLVQVGVARHALDGDRAGLTGAGGALVELVDELVARTAEQVRS
jgi:predicted transcriptional regulator